MTTKKKPHLTLVQQRTANAAFSDENEDDEGRYLADLRGEIWDKAGAKRGSFKKLGEDANVSPRTVQRFASGETKRPMLFTIRRMANALGFELVLKKQR